MFAPIVANQNPIQAAVNIFAVASSVTPALGNMPAQVVPAPIQTIKVADNRPHLSYQRSVPAEMQAAAFVAEAEHEYGDVYLDFPYSSPFLAQLFGQLNMEGSELGAFFVDYETLAQFEEVKYKPSFAFRPRDSLVADLMERQQAFLENVPLPQDEERVVQTQETPRKNDSAQGNPSLYTDGLSAYSAAESRNLLVAVPVSALQGNRQISAMI